MGLRETFKNLGSLVIKIAGNVAVVCDYRIFSQKVYDPVTDIVTEDNIVYSGVKMIFMSFAFWENRQLANVLPTDIKALVSSKDLPIRPGQNNTVTVTSSSDRTIRSGDEYDVLSFTSDPAEAVYTLHLRTKP